MPLSGRRQRHVFQPPPTGRPPQHPVTNLPARRGGTLRTGAQRTAQPCAGFRSTFTVVRMFERAYAESLAYRKQTGISAREVGEVAKMRKAA